MSFYRDSISPHIVTALGNPPPVQKIRQQIIPMATGTVLELGGDPAFSPALFSYWTSAILSARMDWSLFLKTCLCSSVRFTTHLRLGLTNLIARAACASLAGSKIQMDSESPRHLSSRAPASA
jgi:hypothetical protein